jgi:hypothetical protein
MVELLLLRGLFRGFLRGGLLGWGLLGGCLFGCLLGCHFPILPFRWFASICNSDIAVDECIDSCFNGVKKKTMQWWKNGQQFFRLHIENQIEKMKFIDIGSLHVDFQSRICSEKYLRSPVSIVFFSTR